MGDDCFKHRLFLPAKLTDLAAQNQQLGMILLRSLAPIAVARFTDGAVTRRVRRLLDEAQSNQTAEIRRQLEAGAIDKQNLEDELLKMLDDNDTLRRDKETLRIENETAELRVLEIQDENAALKQNFDIIATFQHQPDAIFADTVGEAPEERTFGTVREALDAAAADFAGRLSIWKTAQESADASLFSRPEHVYRALLAIKEWVDGNAEAKATGKFTGTWEQHFKQRGFKYAQKESQTTSTKFKRSRTFTDHGDTKNIERHLTLGGGDKVNCLQIYFDLDDSQEKAIIAYCGEHLPYAGDRT